MIPVAILLWLSGAVNTDKRWRIQGDPLGGEPVKPSADSPNPSFGRLGTNGTDSGVASAVTRGAVRTGGKPRAVAPITSTVADVGNRAGNGQHVSDSGDNYDHDYVEEVIHSNNVNHEFPALTDRLEQPVNRQ